MALDRRLFGRYAAPVPFRRQPRVIIIRHDDSGLFRVTREIRNALVRLERRVDQLMLQGAAEMADLSEIQAAVERDTSVTSSAVTLLNNLSQQIRDLSTDPAALAALADSIDAQTDALAAAVEQNTPASAETPQPTGDTPEPSAPPADVPPSQ